jgi:hypothetical protein
MVVACCLLAAAAACGGDDTASQTPAPEAPAGTHDLTGRIVGPVGDAEDTVDRLNEQQERRENAYP